ncbi:MAG: hypothetical protein JO247_10575, partial [Chloroflexi bacterium]|nr:hypothetical protein [Chloroflexota bacterium]
MVGQPLARPAPRSKTAVATRWGDYAWLLGIGAVTIAYLALLATDSVDGLRGNAQWHIPYVANPSNGGWWLPIVPGALICALPVLPLPACATVSAAMAATCAFAYDLFAAQWGGGDNLMAKIINEPTAFHRAAGDITDLRGVLANFPAYLASFRPASHVPSHPPGDILLFRWLNDLMLASPGLRDATLGWARTFISGTDMLLSSGNQPYLIAGAVAAIPLIIGLGRLAAIPFAALARQMQAPVVASALLFLMLPTTLVHIPLLDTVFPLLSAPIVVAGVAAVERRSWPLALVTGLLFGGSLFYTASIAIVAVPLAVYGLLRGGWKLSWLVL